MRRASAAFAALLLALPAVALAQEAGPAAAARADAPAALSLRLDLGDSGLDREAVRVAIEHELRVPVSVLGSGAPVPGGKGALDVRVSAHRRASVSHDDGRGRTVSRTVELPEDPARAVEVIALLAGNVARNEAEELLAALTPPAPPGGGAAAGSGEAGSREAATASPSGEAPPPVPSAAPPPQAGAVKPTPSSTPVAAPVGKAPEVERPPLAWNLSLWHPVAVVPDSQRKRMQFDLALGYGRSGSLHGLAIAVGHERVDRETEGFLGAALWSHAGGPVHGVQLAGGVVTGDSDLEGADMAGLAAWRDGNVVGAQAAGAVTVADDVEGVQAAGAVTVANDVDGGLAAGAVAVGRDVEGVQLAGAVSVARDVKGLQAAGGVSVARKVRGVQLALVNVAEEIDGAGIGLVTIAGNGRVQPTAWFANTSGAAAGVKFVAGYFFSNVGLSLETDGDHASPFVGGGPHVPIGRWFLDFGADWHPRYDLRDTVKKPRSDLHYRAKLGVEPTRGVTLFAGGGVRHPDIEARDSGVDPEVLFGVSVL